LVKNVKKNVYYGTDTKKTAKTSVLPE